MITDQDILFMKRCFVLANRAGGYNAPNPRVGAVVVYNNTIIGEGHHKQYGEAHAEVNAINSVPDSQKSLLSSSVIYVSLEPCFHTGKTPPCVDLILKHKIPRVVISSVDPFAEVAGKSIRKLKDKGVEVVSGVLEKEGLGLARRFFTNVQRNRPYVLLKFAQSKDGFIGSTDKEIAISNPISNRLVHKWRSEESAIIVGTNTAALDNPRLNNRLYFGRNPLRLVLDRNLRLPKQLHLFDGNTETLVFTEKNNSDSLPNVRFVHLKFDDYLIRHLLRYLHENKIQSLLVEGGRQLLQSFIDSNLWDEARVFSSTTFLNKGVEAPVLPANSLKSSQQLADNTLDVFINQNAGSLS